MILVKRELIQFLLLAWMAAESYRERSRDRRRSREEEEPGGGGVKRE